jgi:hypothetical protein
MSDVTLTEGNTGLQANTFTVTLSAASIQPVTISYATANGSATAGSDYQTASGTLTIPAGQTTGTISVLVNGDTTPEPNESFFVNLTSAEGATIADGQGVGTIVDDDVALPAISISDASVVEGNSGARQMMFTVSLSQASTQEVRVNFATANGTATTGNLDYAAESGTLRFAAGETSRTITVLILGDKKKESDETFLVNLSAAANGTIADGQGVGTILNDDGGAGKSHASAFDAALEEMLNDHNKKRVR